jgi:hypothetical protein
MAGRYRMIETRVRQSTKRQATRQAHTLSFPSPEEDDYVGRHRAADSDEYVGRHRMRWHTTWRFHRGVPFRVNHDYVGRHRPKLGSG